jgi:hypothetical protein
MTELTSDQKNLVEQYQHYSLEELYNLVGNQADEYLTGAEKDRYVLGTPNVFTRGKQIVEDTRKKICERRKELERLGERIKREVLDPIAWVATIADFIFETKILAGLPPIAVAVALGRLCEWSLVKLCVPASGSR